LNIAAIISIIYAGGGGFASMAWTSAGKAALDAL